MIKTAHRRKKNTGNRFILAPNESRVLEILHAPDFIFISMYVTLNIAYRERNNRVGLNFNQVNNYQQKNMQLLLGYDLNARVIKGYHLNYIVIKYYSDGECRRDIFLNVVPFIL